MNIPQRQQELTDLLRKAADAYYNTGETIMSDKQYDALFDELKEIETKTGMTLPGSVTQTVGADPQARKVSALKKVKHDTKMLSLDKTKSRNKLTEWLGDKIGCLSWKMDGLTVVLKYSGGRLVQAVTRGNGEIGDDITHNAPFIYNIPMEIDTTNDIVVRGEAVIHYDDFEKIKATPEGQDYMNPRNLCSGTIRTLDPNVVKARPVHFYAFELVSSEYYTNDFTYNLDCLKEMGFGVVEHTNVSKTDLLEAIQSFSDKIPNNLFPSDGLVLQYNDIAYGKSLGSTGHHPRSGIAFKWQDTTEETTLREIEWSASATGRLNPVAIFDPVMLEGTKVSRASVHNCSIVEQLGLKIGDTITVYKANMIIPQIDENLTMTPGYRLPEITCPICKSKAVIKTSDSDDGTPPAKFAYCPNPDCAAKQLGKFERFVCRDAMDIRGLSSSTIEKLIQTGYLTTVEDLFKLEQYPEIQELDGLGKRSYEKLLNAVRFAASETTLAQVLYAMCIPNIGRTASRDICKRFNNPDSFSALSKDDLRTVNGIGEELAQSFTEWFKNDINRETWKHVLHYVNIKTEPATLLTDKPNIVDKTFVITGSVNHYANRNELKAEIERAGGKVASSVSKNTDYLINNDNTSTSSKNKKAKELGVPIITEDEFITLLNE